MTFASTIRFAAPPTGATGNARLKDRPGGPRGKRRSAARRRAVTAIIAVRARPVRPLPTGSNAPDAKPSARA